MLSSLLNCPSRRLSYALAIFATISCAPPSALASMLWNWHYTGAMINASGTFTTVDHPDAQGGYLITAITGTRNGKTITALQTPGTWIPGNEPYKVDDLVFLGPGPQLTSHGFGFALADGTYSNPFYADFLNPPEYLEFFSKPPFTGGSSTELPVQFSATPVPEPSTYILIVSVLALVALRQQARRQQPSV